MYVYCLGLRSCEISPIHIDWSVGVVIVQVVFRQQYWWNFMGGNFCDSSRKQNLTEDFLFLGILNFFQICDVPWVLVAEVVL